MEIFGHIPLSRKTLKARFEDFAHLCSNRTFRCYHFKLPCIFVLFFYIFLITSGCGYRFSGSREDSPFPPTLKTLSVDSAVNNTVVTGIETELTNDLRREYSLGASMKLVPDGADATLKTSIISYEDTPSAYRADGKELTRIGVLKVHTLLEKNQDKQKLWKKDFAASYTYTVTDSIAGTLSNRRKAISQMIRDLTPRIHRAMYDNF